MKANKFILAIFIPALFLTAGCKECGTIQPEPPSPVTFYIVDQHGRNPFASAGTGYHPDSLRFTLENEPYTYLFSGRDEGLDNIVFETYPVIYDQSGVRMLLHYNKENTDTLDIAYTVTKSQCFTNYSYTSFRYNGKELQRHPVTGHLQLSLQQGSTLSNPTALL
ncbi:hypothetical protein OB13_13875 [Pontibacter sp. HJ8]